MPLSDESHKLFCVSSLSNGESLLMSKHERKSSNQSISQSGSNDPRQWGAPTLIGLGLILLLSFSVRLAWVHHIDPRLYPRTVGVGNEHFLGWDGVRYDDIAENLLSNAGYGYHANQPDAWRPPGYPFFLYAAYRLFGHDYDVIRILQVVMGCLTSLILFLLTLKLTRSKKVSLIAGFLFAIDYYSVLFTSIFYTELFTGFLSLFAIYLFVLADERKGKKFALFFSLASLVFWYAVLCRPSNILFWAWIAIWIYAQHRHHIRRVVISAVIIIATFGVTVLPWTIRNYQLYGKFLLISSNGGFVFFMAHHPISNGGFIPEGMRYSEQQKSEMKGTGPIERDKTHYRFGLDFIKRNPRRSIELAFIKQKWLWLSRENRGMIFDFIPKIPFPLLTFYPLAALAVLGLLFERKRWKQLQLVLGFILFHAGSLSLIYLYHGPRTRITMIPFLVIFSSLGLVAFFGFVRRFWKKMSPH